MAATPGFDEVIASIAVARQAAEALAEVMVTGTETSRAVVEAYMARDASAEQLDDEQDELMREATALCQRYGEACAAVEPKVWALGEALKRRAREDGRPKVMARMKREQAELKAAWDAVSEPLREAAVKLGRTPVRLLMPGKN